MLGVAALGQLALGQLPSGPARTTNAGWDTSDPLYYEWWRRRRKAEEDEPGLPPPELVAEINEIREQPLTKLTPISPALARALIGPTDVADTGQITAAAHALALAELKRIADELDDEEAILLLMQ